MELKLNIGYNELLELIRQLPAKQLAKLKAELNENLSTKNQKRNTNDFQKLLLSGPTMSDTQYDQYLSIRKHINLWRVN